MSDPMKRPEPPASSRRDFLKKSSVALAVGGTLALERAAHGAGDDVLKVGLVGCGGRGNGAASNAVSADANVKLTALCDLFPDQLERARKALQPALKDRYAVDDDHCFTGFDGYKQLMATDVDVVLLCTPPHFRPEQLRAAVEAGKHIFCEKPIAVDATGVRDVLQTTEKAKQKGLNLVSGLCWRYDLGVRETIKRIQDGAIGDIVAIQENYLTGTLWHRQRQPDWSDMEYQLRNWLYYTWLSGDHITEQHVHSLDKAMWLMGDQPPARCFGLGGRLVRSDRELWGNIYDHFAVCYEWPNGVKTFAYTRQMRGCYGDVDDYVLGTKGRAVVLKHRIEGENAWAYPRELERSKPSMYDVEHQELFAAIRAGNTINNGQYMSYSTMLAIMGREACYTGKSITWEEAIGSDQDLRPANYAWGEAPAVEVALPGVG